MKQNKLLELAIKMIQSYNQNRTTPDSHSQIFLQQYAQINHNNNTLLDTQKIFLAHIFYGVYRYNDFLNAFITTFLNISQSILTKNDQTLYKIFTYIICFEFQQLPYVKFRRLVLSQNYKKMNKFFDLIQFTRTLEQTLDISYIDKKIIYPLTHRIEIMKDLVTLIKEKVGNNYYENVSAVSKIYNIKKEVTDCQSFDLTKPKLKLILEPEIIKTTFKANPIGEYKKSLKMIEEEKHKKREEIRENIKKYYSQNQKEFNLLTSTRPSNLQKIKNQLQNQYKKSISQKYFTTFIPHSQVDIKFNLAAILKQQTTINQKIRAQQKKLKDLQINMRDQKQFIQWQSNLKQKDKQILLENYQKRKIEMELTRENAMKEYVEHVKDNQALVKSTRKISSQMKRQRENLQQMQRINKKKHKQNINIEREKFIKTNKQIHDQQKLQIQNIFHKKKKEDDIEYIKKKELVKEIIKLQKIQKVKPKIIDHSETMGYGLLNQISLLESRKRLNQATQLIKKDQQTKRKQNLSEKLKFKEDLLMKKDKIKNYRIQLSKQKQQQKIRKKYSMEQKKMNIEIRRVMSQIQHRKKQTNKLNKKQQDQLKLQKGQFLKSNKAIVEQNSYKNHQLGAQREIRNRQNQLLINKEKSQRIKHQSAKIRSLQIKKQRNAKINFHKEYNENLRYLNKIYEDMQVEDKESKRMRYQTKRIQQKLRMNKGNQSRLSPTRQKQIKI